MIDYHTFSQIQTMAHQENLSPTQIANELELNIKTVKKWINAKRYVPRKGAQRSSCLDPYKSTIGRLLERHNYTAVQLMRLIGEQGYKGGYTILKSYVRKIRPPKRTAYLTLSFAPGECAQIDWGEAGVVQLKTTRRKLYFLAVVLSYSRMLYVQFSFRMSMEHFLWCQRSAFEFFGGIPQKIMVDNCKTAVISHTRGASPVFHPRYADFAQHYGFEPIACNVRSPQEKGQVEKAVDYIKKDLLGGLNLSGISPIQAEADLWRDQVANVRIHRVTRKRPVDLYHNEKAHLRPLPLQPYDCSVAYTVNSNSQFRVRFDANLYSVPAIHASTKNITLRAAPNHIVIYLQGETIARHPRSYERGQDIEHPDHPKPLLQQRRKAKDQILLRRFLAIGPQAENYYRGLIERRFNAAAHVRKIIALCEQYGTDSVRNVIEDALHYQAFSAEYIANLMEQRHRPNGVSSPIHLTRNQDLLELELEPPNLDIYPDNQQEHNRENPE